MWMELYLQQTMIEKVKLSDAENKVESKRKEQQDKIMKEIESQLKGVE